MSSTHPYLIRAIYDWALDNDFTPHLLVDAGLDGVIVPRQFVKDGAIVLNIAPSAVRDLDLGAEFVTFNARFGGVPMQVEVPVLAVRAAYARETGRGIVLPHPDAADGGNDAPEPPPDDKPSGPKLTVVK